MLTSRGKKPSGGPSLAGWGGARVGSGRRRASDDPAIRQERILEALEIMREGIAYRGARHQPLKVDPEEVEVLFKAQLRQMMGEYALESPGKALDTYLGLLTKMRGLDLEKGKQALGSQLLAALGAGATGEPRHRQVPQQSLNLGMPEPDPAGTGPADEGAPDLQFGGLDEAAESELADEALVPHEPPRGGRGRGTQGTPHPPLRPHP